jgi:uncharacterized protein YjaZ
MLRLSSISMRKISYILFLIALFSCQRQDYDFERTELIVYNQKFEILTANKIIENFISRKSNYSKTVYSQIENEFENNSEYPFLLKTLNAKIKPDEKLKKEIEILEKYDFKKIVESTFQRVVKELPGPDTKILFIPANPEYKEIFGSYGIGINAVTVGTGKIIVSINPTIDNWQQLLPYTLAHEYHHSVWTSRNFETSDFTPLEYIIFEGRADYFAKELFPNTKHPFLNNLNKKQESGVWNLIKPELHVRNSELNDKMMSGTNEIPTGSVYSIGFHIIESFKTNNPQISDKELIDMTPKQVLLLSKYDE